MPDTHSVDRRREPLPLDNLTPPELRHAVERFNAELAANPGDDHALIARGLCQRKLGDDHRAVDDFSSAIGGSSPPDFS